MPFRNLRTGPDVNSGSPRSRRQQTPTRPSGFRHAFSKGGTRRVMVEQLTAAAVQRLTYSELVEESQLRRCCLRYLEPKHYDAVVEERPLEQRCGYPACGRSPQPRRMFCSRACEKKSTALRAAIPTDAVGLRHALQREAADALRYRSGAAGAPGRGTGVAAAPLPEGPPGRFMDPAVDRALERALSALGDGGRIPQPAPVPPSVQKKTRFMSPEVDRRLEAALEELDRGGEGAAPKGPEGPKGPKEPRQSPQAGILRARGQGCVDSRRGTPEGRRVSFGDVAVLTVDQKEAPATLQSRQQPESRSLEDSDGDSDGDPGGEDDGFVPLAPAEDEEPGRRPLPPDDPQQRLVRVLDVACTLSTEGLRAALAEGGAPGRPTLEAQGSQGGEEKVRIVTMTKKVRALGTIKMVSKQFVLLREAVLRVAAAQSVASGAAGAPRSMQRWAGELLPMAERRVQLALEYADYNVPLANMGGREWRLLSLSLLRVAVDGLRAAPPADLPDYGIPQDADAPVEKRILTACLGASLDALVLAEELAPPAPGAGDGFRSKLGAICNVFQD